MRALILALGVAACGGAETTQSEAAARSGRPLTAADLRPSSDGSPPLVPPSRLEPYRVAGQPTILPDERGSARMPGTFGFCLDESGRITSVTMLATTHDERYDAKIIATMHSWAYRPVVIDGRPPPVCSRITFIYNH